MEDERSHSKLNRMFKDILSDAKEAMKTRVNEKTGTYYVKGQGGYTRPLNKENSISGLSQYSSDPDKEQDK